MAILKAHWEGLLERGNAITIMLRSGHMLMGDLKESTKGYVLVDRYYENHFTYFELDEVVAVTERVDENWKPFGEDENE